MKRAKTLFLALLMALTLVPTASMAGSEVYGSEIWFKDTRLQDSVVYSDNIFWSNTYQGPRHERYFTYTPDPFTTVRPVVSYGNAVCSRLTAADAALSYESLGYRVVGAVNGDFYDPNKGFPLGLVVSGGELRSSGENYYAVGFRADGSVVMGEPKMSITATNALGQTLPVAALNKPRVDGSGPVLLTYDFIAAHTTGVTTDGVTVVAEIVGDRAAIGRTMMLQVVGVVTGAEPVALTETQAALTVSAASPEEAKLFVQSMQPGELFTVSFAAQSEEWNDVTEAVGALYLLVSGGVAQTGFTDKSTRARTAVGVKADGSLVLYTIDGDQKAVSVGTTMAVLARRMEELGCVTALCLDGGGSTTASAALPGDTAAQGLNSPSDGAQRRVTNHILLVADGMPTGWPGQVYLTASAPAALTGGAVDLTAQLVDTNFFPMPDEVVLIPSAGYIENGVLTMPEEPGVVTVTAFWGDLSASLDILALDTPDELTVLRNGRGVTSLNVAPGESVQLDASAYFRHQKLTANNLLWSVDPALGTIDETGRFTAAITLGEGAITVSRGSLTATIPVKVEANFPFVDMEGHWATVHVASMYRQGVLTGVQVGDEMYAYPDRSVTREEFATLLARYLGLDLTGYAGYTPPFADMDQVSGWARDAVCAMYDLGIVTGAASGDTLRFDPKGTLTRAQAVTMLGRMMAYLGAEPAVADLSQFADAADLPLYSLEHFQTLVALGVINGSNGLLSPGGDMNRASICKVLDTIPHQ